MHRRRSFLTFIAELIFGKFKRKRKKGKKHIMTLQEIKDQVLVLIDEAHAVGVAEGQSGSPMFTQEQLDAAVAAAKAEQKAAIAALVDAQQLVESASEQSLKDQILAL